MDIKADAMLITAKLAHWLEELEKLAQDIISACEAEPSAAHAQPLEHAARKIMDAKAKLGNHPSIKVQHAHAEGQVITVSTKQEVQSVGADDVGKLLHDPAGKNVCEGLQIDFKSSDAVQDLSSENTQAAADAAHETGSKSGS